MKQKPNPETTSATQAPSVVADANCKDFHYTNEDLALIEKKKAESKKIDLGLQKYQGYY